VEHGECLGLTQRPCNVDQLETQAEKRYPMLISSSFLFQRDEDAQRTQEVEMDGV
jgi:hypothetical protein